MVIIIMLTQNVDTLQIKLKYHMHRQQHRNAAILNGQSFQNILQDGDEGRKLFGDSLRGKSNQAKLWRGIKQINFEYSMISHRFCLKDLYYYLMRQNCKNTIISIIKTIKNLQQNKNYSQAMLIVDQFTSSLLSSVVYYFFALGVKNITKISLKKKPQPNCIGIYYLSPKSLKLINEDFKSQAIYHSINILMSEEVTPQIINSLAAQSKIMQRLAFFGQLKLSTKYLDNNLGIICQEQQIFKALIKNQHKKSISLFANRLFESIVSGYGNKFILKVYYQHNQHIQQIIKILVDRYNEHSQYHKDKGADMVDEEAEIKVVHLLLVDRKIDLISPIVRNFYYFTMISELFNVDYENRKIKVRQEEKTIELSYDDAIFNQYKNLHISKAQNTIQPNFKKFKAENKAAQLNKEKNLENVEIKHIIRDLPEFNKKITSYESQISLMYEISTLSKEQSIPQIGEVEQLIVSGISGHGEQVKDKKIYQKAMEICTKILNQNYLVKIWLLLLFCNDLSESDKKALIHKIKEVPAYHQLGLTLQSKLNMIIPKPIKMKPQFKKEKVFLDLHECLVTAIISEITQKGMSKTVNFKLIGDEPKKTESKFKKIGKVENKQWLICMFGGLSINQICQLQRLQTSYENIKINMLTDRIYTTWSYINQLSNIFS